MNEKYQIKKERDIDGVFVFSIEIPEGWEFDVRDHSDALVAKKLLNEQAGRIAELEAELQGTILICPNCKKSNQVEYFEGHGYLCHTCEIHIGVAVKTKITCPVCFDTGWVDPHDCGCAWEAHCKCSVGYDCPNCQTIEESTS